MVCPLLVPQAALVEGGGRFLLRTPETKVRMENMLEVS